MKKEYYAGRRVLSQGMEHIALISKTNPNVLLKISRPFNYLSMIGKDQPSVIREEFAEGQSLLEHTTVRIPNTTVYSRSRRILGINIKGYIIRQSYIEEDQSIPNVEQHLQEQGLVSLVDEFKHEPRNFISHDGVLYWIYPTKGTAGRVLESLKLMKLERYRKIRRKLSKVIRAVGL